MKIAYAGGGSLGPVTPLLAAHERILEQDPGCQALWFGTPDGPERALVEARGIPFVTVPVAKWPRFLSWDRLLFPFRYLQAVQRVRRILRQERPDIIVSAGGFTAVPVVRVAARLGIPCLAHQLDWLPGLANRFLADRCTKVTSSFAYDVPPFGKRVSVEMIPTPVQFSLDDLPARSQAVRQLGLVSARPILLVMGGGTGATSINDLVTRSWLSWQRRGWQVIHLTGKGKLGESLTGPGIIQKELCLPEEMRVLYGAADLVVMRAGLGAISEAVSLRKPMVLVPLPGSAQEANARAFAVAGGALVIPQAQEGFDLWIEKAVQRLLRDAAFARLTVDRAAKVLETDRGEALAAEVLGLVGRSRLDGAS